MRTKKSELREMAESCFVVITSIVVVLLIASVIVVGAWWIFDTFGTQPTDCYLNEKSQSCLDARMVDCLLTDRYSRDECIRLVSSK